MRPLRALVLVYATMLTPSNAELTALGENGWSVATQTLPLPRGDSLGRLLDRRVPHLVHMCGQPPIWHLLSVRIRGLPVVLEQVAASQSMSKRLTTLSVPARAISHSQLLDLHHLYLATLNIAFAPPVIRAQTIGPLMSNKADR